jgi:predicted HAD superfamily phosphohydrolase
MADNNNNHSETRFTRYEDILRAIGRYIDEEGIQDVTVLQTNDEVRVHGYRNVSTTGALRPRLIEHTFTAEEIRKIHEESQKRRGTGSSFFD